MPLLSKIITDATGMSEEEARTKLITIMQRRGQYPAKRGVYGEVRLAEIGPDNSWGFIADVLGNDPQILIKLLKKRRKANAKDSSS